MTRKTAPTALNLLVTGHANTGKTTWVNAMKQYFPDLVLADMGSDLADDVQLSIVDTSDVAAAIDHITLQFDAQLTKESRIKRDVSKLKKKDDRVHVILFFLEPAQILKNKGLDDDDFRLLQKVAKMGNVLVAIGKCDSLSSAERKLILDYSTAALRDVPIWKFAAGTSSDDDDDEQDQDHQDLHREATGSAHSADEEANEFPVFLFANGDTTAQGDQTFKKEYPWGMLNVLDEKHTDFLKFPEWLCEFCQDYIHDTRAKFYEAYRSKKLIRLTQELDKHKVAKVLSEGMSLNLVTIEE